MDGQACLATDWKEGRAADSPAIEAFGLVSLSAPPCHRSNHILNIKRERAHIFHIPFIGDCNSTEFDHDVDDVPDLGIAQKQQALPPTNDYNDSIA